MIMRHDTDNMAGPVARTGTERHPLMPFLPGNARLLMLGSFPPKKERWSMDFFYPNFNNDMWRIIGMVFFGDRRYFETCCGQATDGKPRKFDRERIAGFCSGKGIALYDAACEVRRLRDNASDKFLEIVTPTDIGALLASIPECNTIAATGEKAAEAVSAYFGCGQPATGHSIIIDLHKYAGNGLQGRDTLTFWRMPSSSRAYPLALDAKAGIYRQMFIDAGLL